MDLIPLQQFTGIRKEFLSLVDSLVMLEQSATTDEEVVETTVGDSLDEIIVDSTETEVAAIDGVGAVEDKISEDVSEQTPAQSEFSAAIQILQEWFETELVSMEESVKQAISLPLLSSASGNGVAYSKFLWIYNEFNGVSENNADRDVEAVTGSGVETEI